MKFTNQVGEFAKKRQLFCAGDRVLVAVSGGPDSVALLYVLYDLREELGLDLEIAHVQHGLRGADAREDARAVAALAESLDLPFHLKEANIPELRKLAGKGNLEALAREERYRFFLAVARARAINKIATAHTLDDQAETVLMWFLRGCGAKGLSGMWPLHQLQSRSSDLASTPMLVRPFLGISKAEILEYLNQRQISYRMDRTNNDPALLRNWIRLRLLPQISERIGSGWPARLAHQADLFRDEDRFMDRLARMELETLAGPAGLNRKLLAKQAPALQRRILRLWIAEARGHLRGLDFGHIEEALRLIVRGASQARLSMPGGWELVNQYKTAKLLKSCRRKTRLCYSYEFKAGAVLCIPEAGMLLESKRITAPPAARPTIPVTLTEVLFDAASLSANLFVRNFRPGDRLQPLGMSGHKKVKDLFIEKKLPLPLRTVLPLLSMGGEILWIPAYARSETARIRPQTKEFLYVKAVPLKD